MDSISQRIIARQIDEAMARHNLPTSSPIRSEIESRIQIHRTGGISVFENNLLMRVDDFIHYLKQSGRFASEFGPEPPRVSRHDMEKLRDNFDRIRDGSVVAE